MPMLTFLLATSGHAFSPIGKPANRMVSLKMAATATPVETTLATVSNSELLYPYKILLPMDDTANFALYSLCLC